MQTIATKNYTIYNSETPDYYYFEHNLHGEDKAGGLWFKNNELIDYDGVFEVPVEVIVKMTFEGFDMAYALDEDEDEQ